jgi:hypothetical protein
MKLIFLKLFTLSLLSVQSIGSTAQGWRPYGIDDLVMVLFQQQPEIKDTLGQTFFIAGTEYGTTMINKMEAPDEVQAQKDLDSFYESFFAAITKGGDIEVLSRRIETLGRVQSVRYTYHKKSQDLFSQGALVLIDHRAYNFQHLYNDEYAQQAVVEQEVFFNSIQFKNDFIVKNQIPTIPMKIVFLIGQSLVIAVPMLAALLIGVVVYVIKKRRNRDASL